MMSPLGLISICLSAWASVERRYSASDVKLDDKAFETHKIIAMCVTVREWCVHSHPVEEELERKTCLGVFENCFLHTVLSVHTQGRCPLTSLHVQGPGRCWTAPLLPQHLCSRFTLTSPQINCGTDITSSLWIKVDQQPGMQVTHVTTVTCLHTYWGLSSCEKDIWKVFV